MELLGTKPSQKSSTKMMSGKDGSMKRSSRVPASPLNKSNMNGSLNPRTVVPYDNLSTMRKAKVSEFENNTIVKQRHELNLMVEELKDRDMELNRMVEAHQKQLLAWEKDRRTILGLDEKLSRLESELQLKNDEIRALTSKMRVMEAEITQRNTALSNAQQQLTELSEQQSTQLLRMDELHDRNQHLSNTARDLNNSIGQLEAREQELLTVHKLKDKDLAETSKHIAELTAKLKKVEVACEAARRNEAEYRRNADEWKNKYNQSWREYEHFKREFQKADTRCGDQHTELQNLKHECATLKKDLTLSSEREKRTGQLLEMQKNKQERSDRELQNMRDLFAQQEKEIALLKLNLEGTRDVMEKQQQRYLAKGLQMRPDDVGRSRSPIKLNTTADMSFRRSRSPDKSGFSANERSPVRIDYARSESPVSRMKLKSTSPSRMADYSYTSSLRTSRSPDTIPRSLERSPLKSMSPTRLRSAERSRSPERRLHYSYTSGPKFELYTSPKKLSTYSRDQKSGSYKSLLDAEVGGVSSFNSKDNSPYKSYDAKENETYHAPSWSSVKELSEAADLLVEKYYPRHADSNVDETVPEERIETVSNDGNDDAALQKQKSARADQEDLFSDAAESIKSFKSAASSQRSHISTHSAPKEATNSVRSLHDNVGSEHSNHSNANSILSTHSNANSVQSVHGNSNAGLDIQSPANSVHSNAGSVHSVDNPNPSHHNNADSDCSARNSVHSFQLESGDDSMHSVHSNTDEKTPRTTNENSDAVSRDLVLTMNQDDQASAQSTPRSQDKTGVDNPTESPQENGDINKVLTRQSQATDELDDMFSHTSTKSASNPDRTSSGYPKFNGQKEEAVDKTSEKGSLIGSVNGSFSGSAVDMADD